MQNRRQISLSPGPSPALCLDLTTPPTPNASQTWAAIGAEMHSVFTRFLAQTRDVQAWLDQTPGLTEVERVAMLAHLAILQETAGRLLSLTESWMSSTEEMNVRDERETHGCSNR